jgi:erythromycin esterase-like protein
MEDNMFGLGRLQLIIIGGVILFGTLSGIYYSWRSGIEREALLEYNQKQLEQTLADQKAFKEKMEALEAKQQEIIKQNAEEKKLFEERIGGINTFLDSTETKKNDKASSPILKQTINMLKDAPK